MINEIFFQNSPARETFAEMKEIRWKRKQGFSYLLDNAFTNLAELTLPHGPLDHLTTALIWIIW
ncbi:Protein CBG27431 [Caenorhabditis briggsae]|uniref:Protein CBG27431 n=1 Tax=Caenorhabditis briggsae TaxID=6238 RepID=B6IK08_CAEBR|nr:Protein CBG27431 [Caenorhabditis briggsae]CAS00238.1 Protein CBG27431 [Caenorhabditis briggsae]